MSVSSRREKVKQIFLSEEMDRHNAMIKKALLIGIATGVVIGQFAFAILGV